MQGINAVKKGLCHIGAAHLLQKEDGDYNFSYLKDLFGEDFVLVNFAYRIQGLIIAPNNPKNMKGIEDLIRPDITMVNRGTGTGTRFLLEFELEKKGIDPNQIKGYNKVCLSHLDVGIEILSGRADIGIGIEAVAQMLSLEFIPSRKERFDLIIRKGLFSDNKIQSFIAFLHSDELKEYSRRFSGYDLKDIGNIIYEK